MKNVTIRLFALVLAGTFPSLMKRMRKAARCRNLKVWELPDQDQLWIPILGKGASRPT